VKDADWGFSTYRTSVSELREADRRMGQNAAGRREHGVSWDLADLEPEEDELGLPTTAGMLAPALTAEQQEEGPPEPRLMRQLLLAAPARGVVLRVCVCDR